MSYDDNRRPIEDLLTRALADTARRNVLDAERPPTPAAGRPTHRGLRGRPWFTPLLAAACVAVVAIGILAVRLSGHHPATDHRTTPPPTPSATQTVDLRPVDGHGNAAPGWSVVSGQGGIVVTCDHGDSFHAGQRITSICSPDTAFPVACYRAAQSGSVLCVSDVWRQQLTRWNFRSGPEAGPSSPVSRPIALDLANGQRCTLRIGGAAARLTHYPTWSILWFCRPPGAAPGSGGMAVSPTASLPGTTEFDRSAPQWTVHFVPSFDGMQSVVGVIRVYYSR